MPELGKYHSPYKNGEVKALIAPLLGCSAEDIGQVLIIARDASMQKIGVFHTMYCEHSIHADCKALDLVGEYLQDTAMRIFEESPQHGPAEG